VVTPYLEVHSSFAFDMAVSGMVMLNHRPTRILRRATKRGDRYHSIIIGVTDVFLFHLLLLTDLP